MQRVEQQTVYSASPFIRYIFYGIAAFLLAILHMSFLHWISVSGIAPDLLLLLSVWIGVAEGRLPGMIGGFLSGVLLDMISGDVLGTNALAKTIAGFAAGYFYSETSSKKTLASFKLLGVIALAAFIHNCIYFFFYVKPTEIQYLDFFLKYGLASTLYTTVAGYFSDAVQTAATSRAVIVIYAKIQKPMRRTSALFLVMKLEITLLFCAPIAWR